MTDEPTESRSSMPARDGWDFYQPPDGAAGLHIRWRRDPSGRWVISDLYLHGSELTADMLRRISLSRIEARRNRDPDAAPDVENIGRPDGSDPERFYRQVALAYRQYAAESRAPARAIADAAQVPVTTVHRWIREARNRGFLPPGRKGRVG